MGELRDIATGHDWRKLPNDVRIKMLEADAEIERLRDVLDGVRGAILTGRNEPLQIWKDQIDIALDKKEPD